KTGYPVKLPLTEKTAAALRDYILNGRRHADCEFLFLKLRPPYEKIGDAVALGCMFRSYQKAAGIEHSAFDGKGFHSLRRRLGRELVIDGVPLATISQVLGHRDTEAAKQYISLDSIHLQECALDFSLIGGRRHD
ncbi:MAG: tyrosine-type recombinase/integrase, partial [Oliverpabstia sp.]